MYDAATVSSVFHHENMFSQHPLQRFPRHERKYFNGYTQNLFTFLQKLFWKNGGEK
jgi:hypothetical protein